VPPSRRQAPSEIETETTCHTHQAEQPTSGPGSRRRDFSAEAGRCEQEIRSVSAFARLSRFSNSAAGLFSVGRRGVARAAVCSRCPATRAPAKQTIESHFTRPPIRITSDLRGPEAVVIETSQPDLLPVLPGKEFSGGPSPPPSPDVADAVLQPPLSERADASDGSPAISTRVRETLAQLGPVVSDHAGLSRKRVELTSEPQRNFAQTRSEKRRRSARHPSFDTHQ
jgi:hypothetical protein